MTWAATAAAMLRAERWRREVHEMPPHPALAAHSLDDLRASFREAAWFGPADDRSDPWLATTAGAPLLAHAQRVCYLIGEGAVASVRRGRARLHSTTYGEYHNLCREERFWSQPIVLERDGEAAGGYGYTGYLLSSRHVLTAWHGWDAFSHRSHVAIFGYSLRDERHPFPIVRARDVVRVSPYPRLQPGPQRAQRADGAEDCSNDWVVLELERPPRIPGAAVLPPTIAPRRGAAVYALGHPCGLPLKLVDAGTVLQSSPGHFRTNLGTFSGNSGSPVFDAASHALVGLVSEGQKDQGDFEPSPARGCYVTNRIDQHVTGQLCVPVTCFRTAFQVSGSM